MKLHYRSTVAEVDVSHLKHNCQALRALMPPKAFFCPMVKANAYGHGDVMVTQALQEVGVSSVGVALIEEAIN